MFEILRYPFKGFGADLKNLLGSLHYILYVRIALLGVVVRHLWQRGDSAALAASTKFTAPHRGENVCNDCTESAYRLRSAMHHGAVRDVALVTQLGGRRYSKYKPVLNPQKVAEVIASEPEETV